MSGDNSTGSQNLGHLDPRRQLKSFSHALLEIKELLLVGLGITTGLGTALVFLEAFTHFISKNPYPFLFLLFVAVFAAIVGWLLVIFTRKPEIVLLPAPVPAPVIDEMQGSDWENEFCGLAFENAAADKAILEEVRPWFDSLDHAVSTGIAEASTPILFGNLQAILDHAAGVFSQVTKETCCVCIRTLSPDEQMMLRIKRDRRNSLLRDHVGPSSVHDNTAAEFIVSRGGRCYANNDLKAALARGEYINRRPGWADNYNSTLVFGIPVMQESEYPAKRMADHDGPYCGLFCVDSMRAKLDTPRCRRFAQEFAWRLAVIFEKLRFFGDAWELHGSHDASVKPRLEGKSA